MKKLIRFFVVNPITWPIIKLLYKVVYRFKFEKELIEIEKEQSLYKSKQDKLKAKFVSLTVQNGPFKGMVYPEFIAHGSSMFSKLLGSYESELYPLIDSISKNSYAKIIDIGCAEGYYAVGMARLYPNSEVFEYDINQNALQSCKKMAELNHVKNITYDSFCSPETLGKYNFEKHSLIICDCEGFEMELFNKENSSNLLNCDILIELHDLYNEQISYHIDQLFSKTHDLKYIYSQNTFKKLDELGYMKSFSVDEIKTFFTERNGIMQWVFISKKK